MLRSLVGSEMCIRDSSTISRETNRNLGYDDYRATQVDLAAWDKARRPKLCNSLAI